MSAEAIPMLTAFFVTFALGFAFGLVVRLVRWIHDWVS
jgi:hypothetical protein